MRHQRRTHKGGKKERKLVWDPRTGGTMLQEGYLVFLHQQKEDTQIQCFLTPHLETEDIPGKVISQNSRRKGGDMGIYVYVELIHFVIKQKLTHQCKAIILQ